MEELTLYQCEICCNLVCMIDESGVDPTCCGQAMKKIEANTVDASREKHVPAVIQNNCHLSVTVGEEPHPMLPRHHIQWIAVLTDRDVYGKHLSCGEKPCAEFDLCSDEVIKAVYAFCSLHGLWKKEF